MALETKLVQKMGQSLLMTPQLQQAIKLLQLNRLEYIEAIQKELLENPILEETKEQEEAQRENKKQEEQLDAQENSEKHGGESELNTEPPKELNNSDDTPVAWEDYLQHFNDYSGAPTQRGTFDFEDRPSLEATLTKEISLVDHLIEQLRLSDLDAKEKFIALHIVGNINTDGYFVATLEEVAESAECTPKEVDEVLELFQTMDPPGVGSRDIQECLLTQLEHRGLGESLQAKIVRDHLDKLEKRKYNQIAKELNSDVKEVYEAIQAIQCLEPRPGRPFADTDARYITPDIYVYKVDGEYVISLNEDGMPKLRISPYYLDILKRQSDNSSEERTYLNDRMKAASWLIKSIHQRQQTIYKVTESIVKTQKDFLAHGIEHLKPMVLKDVAEDIGMHESTVSRVTTNKYVHTPQGVFELKFFFSSGIKTSGGEVSSSSVKEKIKNLIAEEKPTSPISDQQVVDLLAEQGVKIARRTVAKYRESLGILSSSKRKRPF